MPTIQFLDRDQKTFDGSMPTPKRVTELKYWYKAARTALPRANIPSLSAGVEGGLVCPESKWLCTETTVTESYIVFKLLFQPTSERATLVIKRTRGAF